MKLLKEYSEYILSAFLLLFIIIGGVIFLNHKNKNYTEKIFDDTFIHEIKIEMSEENLELMQENAKHKFKYQANITIDGEKFKDVSISTHGNGTLFDERLPETKKYSLRINFGKYREGQNYYGLDKLVLDNLFSDSSGMKNYLAYDMMRSVGVPAPLCSYTKVTINSDDYGLFLATEYIDESFLIRNGLYDEKTALYKPISPAIDFSKKLDKLDAAFPGEELGLESTDSDEYDAYGSDLKYIDDNAESYPAIFDNEVIKSSPELKDRTILAIKSLETGVNYGLYWDVKEIAKYFAVHNFLLNFDSYTGKSSHNYYLLQNDGKLSVLPWDYDNTFSLDKNAINKHINQPISDDLDPEDRPLWNTLSKNETFLNFYHEKIQELIDDYILSGIFENKAQEIRKQIFPYMKTPELDYAYDSLFDFMQQRTDAVQKQLWGIND